MNPKHFLEYLCSIGLGRRDTLTVPAPCPDYPFSKSIYVQKGSTFYTTQHCYTIEIPIPLAVQDNTHIETNISLPGSQVTQSPAFWKSLLDFLVDLARSNHVYHQRYGVTFLGGQGGWDYSKYRADKRDAMDISPLSAVTSVAMPNQVGKDPLNFATALNYIKDIILSLESNGTIGNRGQSISNKVENSTVSKKRRDETEQKKLAKYNLDRINEGVSISVTKEDEEEALRRGHELAKRAWVKFTVQNIATLSNGKGREYHSYHFRAGHTVKRNKSSKEGDTISVNYMFKQEGGEYKIKNIEVVYDGEYIDRSGYLEFIKNLKK